LEGIGVPTQEYIKINEKYLVEAGVSPEHLDKMKKEIVQGHDHYHYFYDYVGEKETFIVPVNKIKGLSRGEDGRTWWDHITSKAGNLSWIRIQNLRRRIEEKGLEEFRRSFEDPSYRVELNYYDYEDSYYVGGDGNHRTLWAKIVDAPFICARVSRYSLSPTKWINYQNVQDWKEKLRSLLERYNLQLVNGHIEANGWSILYLDPTYTYIYDYGDKDQVHAVLDEYSEVISLLEGAIDFHRKLRFISDIRIRKFILAVLYIFSKHERVYEVLLDLYNAGWNKSTD